MHLLEYVSVDIPQLLGRARASTLEGLARKIEADVDRKPCSPSTGEGGHNAVGLTYDLVLLHHYRLLNLDVVWA